MPPTVALRLAAFATLSLSALAPGCTREPTIQLVGTAMPPHFKLSGDARTFGVIFSTPAAPVNGAPRFDVFWHLRPARDGVTPSEVPEFTYGAPPSALRAIRFEGQSTQPVADTSPPPALTPGRVYIASLSTSTPNAVATTYRDAEVCFVVQGRTVATVNCPPRR